MPSKWARTKIRILTSRNYLTSKDKREKCWKFMSKTQPSCLIETMSIHFKESLVKMNMTKAIGVKLIQINSRFWLKQMLRRLNRITQAVLGRLNNHPNYLQKRKRSMESNQPNIKQVKISSSLNMMQIKHFALHKVLSKDKMKALSTKPMELIELNIWIN